MTRTSTYGLIAIALVAMHVALATGPAHAHGELTRTKPAANSVLTKGPNEIVLVMSEAIDAGLSGIKVFDKEGLRVDLEATRSVDGNSLAVAVRPLDPGTYTVVWQVTSVSDGHRSSGLYRFTVSGGGRLFLGTGRTVSAPDETDPTLTRAAVRWGELIGLALVTGAIGSLIVVWRPGLPAVLAGEDARVRRRLRFLALAGLGALAIALTAELIANAAEVSSASGLLRDSVLETLAATYVGRLYLSRLAVVLVLGLLWYRFMRVQQHTVLWYGCCGRTTRATPDGSCSRSTTWKASIQRSRGTRMSSFASSMP